MRLREGFVSNSSSSSFLVLITKTNYQRFVKKLDPASKLISEHLKEEDKVLGKEAVKFSYVSDSQGNDSWNYTLEDADIAEELKNLANDSGLDLISIYNANLPDINDDDYEMEYEDFIQDVIDDSLDNFKASLNKLAEEGKAWIHEEFL